MEICICISSHSYYRCMCVSQNKQKSTYLIWKNEISLFTLPTDMFHSILVFIAPHNCSQIELNIKIFINKYWPITSFCKSSLSYFIGRLSPDLFNRSTRLFCILLYESSVIMRACNMVHSAYNRHEQNCAYADKAYNRGWRPGRMKLWQRDNLGHSSNKNRKHDDSSWFCLWPYKETDRVIGHTWARKESDGNGGQGKHYFLNK